MKGNIMKVTVLHMDRNEITGDTEGFTPVAEVNFPDGHNTMDILEYAFRWTNNIMGSWSKKIGEDANDDVTVLVEREDGLGLRSTSVFDRMEIGGIVYQVDFVGFKELGYVEEVA
jgi:hypothetical protein